MRPNKIARATVSYQRALPTTGTNLFNILFHNHGPTTKFKTNTIKIRAPSDLKAGYEFTATIQGNVVQAIVVSILNIGFYKVINVVLCRS